MRLTLSVYNGQNEDSTLYGVFAKCWFPKAVEIRILLGARLLANSFLACPCFCFNSRWLNSLSLFPKIVPSLTASPYFFEAEEDSGKGQKQVRNRSETPKRQHLPSIHPSIHLISYHCYFYYYYYYFYYYYYYYYYYDYYYYYSDCCYYYY